VFNTASNQIADQLCEVALVKGLDLLAEYCDIEWLNRGVRVARALIALRRYYKAVKEKQRIPKNDTAMLVL